MGGGGWLLLFLTLFFSVGGILCLTNCSNADLREDGTIVHNGNEFVSPSAFSIYVRKLVGTHQDSSNGWQAVRYIEGETATKLIVLKNKAIASNKVSIVLNAGDVGEGGEKDGNKMEVDAEEEAGVAAARNNKRPAEETAVAEEAAPPAAKRAKVAAPVGKKSEFVPTEDQPDDESTIVDEVVAEDGGAEELSALKNEADMSIEELRAMYGQ